MCLTYGLLPYKRKKFFWFLDFISTKLLKECFINLTAKLSSSVTEIIFYNLSQHTPRCEEKRKLRTRKGFAFQLNRKEQSWTLLTEAGIVSLQSLFVNLRWWCGVQTKMQYSLWSKKICKSRKYRIIVRVCIQQKMFWNSWQPTPGPSQLLALWSQKKYLIQ